MIVRNMALGLFAFLAACNGQIKITLENGKTSESRKLTYEGGGILMRRDEARILLAFKQSGIPFKTDTDERLRIYIFGKERYLQGKFEGDSVKSFFVRVQMRGSQGILKIDRLNIEGLRGKKPTISAILASDSTFIRGSSYEKVILSFDRLRLTPVSSLNDLDKYESEYESGARRLIAPDW